METVNRERLDVALKEKEYLVLLFTSAMDVGSVLAENALSSLEGDYADICTFCKSDITEDVELADRYTIHSVPRLLVFHNGSLEDKVTGVMSHSVMKGWLSRHLIRH